MTDVDHASPAPPRAGAASPISLTQSFVVALVAGAALVAAARGSAVALVVVVALVQALLALAWVYGTSMPGRKGGLVVAVLAAAGADVAVCVRPHGQLGVLVSVLALIIPAAFVHQLFRGAARVQVVASLGAVTVLATAEVAVAALVQLRHEVTPAGDGGKVVAAVVAAAALALAVAFLADSVVSPLRFDPELGRGLTGLVLGAVAGGAVGYALLREVHRFDGGRGAFLGAAVGALGVLVSVASTFVLHTTPEPAAARSARLRAALPAVVPLAALAPVAFLLCLAIRT